MIALLIGDSMADGDTYHGSPVPLGGTPADTPRVWTGSVNQWQPGDPHEGAHAAGSCGMFAAHALPGAYLYRAVTRNQSIANLTATNSTVWQAVEDEVDAAGLRPTVAVIWHGTADAGSVTWDAYRYNLHVLHGKAEELGCKYFYVVKPIRGKGGASISDVREATEKYAAESGAVLIDIDHLWLSEYLEPGGDFMSPLGYAAAGRAVRYAIGT